MEMVVGIKLCGNCNPVFDVKAILKKVQATAPCRFISYEESGYDLLLVINSCAAACAKYRNLGSECLIVNGMEFKGKRYESEAELIQRIAEEIVKTGDGSKSAEM